jgi:nitrogenase molybdenum-iron protein alpha/beta subunit
VDTDDVLEITEHLDLENAIAELHDELYRVADYDELGSKSEAKASMARCQAYMNAINAYLERE